MSIYIHTPLPVRHATHTETSRRFDSAPQPLDPSAAAYSCCPPVRERATQHSAICRQAVLTYVAGCAADPCLDRLVRSCHCQVQALVAVPRAAVLPRPLQHLQVSASRRPTACPPAAAILYIACVTVPLAAVLPRPLQQPQMPIFRRHTACPSVPCAIVRPRPLRHPQMHTHPSL